MKILPGVSHLLEHRLDVRAKGRDICAGGQEVIDSMHRKSRQEWGEEKEL